MRRGLESENVRTDMGSNPELLRQSTHSLLHKPTKAKEEAKMFGNDSCTADLLVLKKPTRHGADSQDNLMSDDINVALSRQSVASRKKPAQKARNNNYFAQESEQDQYSAAKRKQKEHAAEQLEDEDEGGIVGQVDDAEEFKLGKFL